MRIEDLRRRETGDGAAVEATIVWERADRQPVRLAFRTTAAFADDLTPAAEAFVTAALWPAWEAGESRLRVEGTLCPRLRDGLLTVQQVLGTWYGIETPFVELEPDAGWAPPLPASPPRAAMFLSGGIDSLALLRQLRDAFPSSHPAAVRDAFFAYGLDLGGPQGPARPDLYERARAGLETLCRGEGVALIPVWTNVRELEIRGKSWPDAFFGLGTVSIAHAFAGRISEVSVAASLPVAGLSPAGSHPMLDPYFSSAALDVRHEGMHLTRMEKTAVVAAWPEALRELRVCYQDTGEDGPLNCGRCRKCVRAMLGLLALGRLEEATSFPVRDVTPAMLEACTVDRHMVAFYTSLLDPLERVGRQDLASGLRRRLRRFARRARWRSLRQAFVAR